MRPAMRRYCIAFYGYRMSELPLWEYCVDADTSSAALVHALSLRPKEVAAFRWIQVREV